jgi:hypothetical protein
MFLDIFNSNVSLLFGLLGALFWLFIYTIKKMNNESIGFATWKSILLVDRVCGIGIKDSYHHLT